MLEKNFLQINKHFFYVRICFFTVLLIISFNYPTHGELLLDIKNITRVCLTVADNKAYQTGFKPKSQYCEGWHCWQSQLKIDNKLRITRIINAFRNDLATDIINMHKLSWHWTLELEALRASKKCNRRYLEIYKESRNIEGLGSSLHCENGCLYKTMTQNPSQSVLIQVLEGLLKNNSLQDFDSNGHFRRANAMYIGCSLVVRSAITDDQVYADIYHLVCVFCTSERKMHTIYGNPATESKCPPVSVRGASVRYPRLCAVEGRRSLFICPSYFHCPLNETEKPTTWRNRDPGHDIELTMVETEVGPTLIVSNETIGSYDAEGNPSFHTQNYFLDTNGTFLKFLSYYPPLPKAVYTYTFRYIQHYSSILYRLTNGTLTALRSASTEKTVVYEPDTATEGYTDAWCCIYMLILSSILTCMLVVLFCYTIYDYVRKRVY